MPGVPLADIALGPDGKLLIQNGRFVIITDHEARKQILSIALQHFMGEWYRDENAGTDYRGSIVGKATEMSQRAELRRRCLSVPGIASVQSMRFKKDRMTRALDVQIDTVATDGTVISVSASIPGAGG
jgi:hypothetical protein